jgi:hypothetical protein
MRFIALIFSFLLITSESLAHLPENGCVPDEKTAIKIAEAVLIPIYGEKLIKSEEPFVVRMEKGIWIIEGKSLPKFSVGGVVHIEISKKDGRILHVIHGK